MTTIKRQSLNNDENIIEVIPSSPPTNNRISNTDSLSGFDDDNIKVEINRDYLNDNDKKKSNQIKKNKNEKNQFINFITSKLFIIFMILITILITVLCIGLTANYEMVNPVEKSVKFLNENLSKEQAIWYNKGIEELKIALGIQLNMKRAKNVILFMGDGMGPNTITASRIYKYTEEGLLSWEKFPHMGMLKVSIVCIQLKFSIYLIKKQKFLYII